MAAAPAHLLLPFTPQHGTQQQLQLRHLHDAAAPPFCLPLKLWHQCDWASMHVAPVRKGVTLCAAAVLRQQHLVRLPVAASVCTFAQMQIAAQVAAAVCSRPGNAMTEAGVEVTATLLQSQGHHTRNSRRAAPCALRQRSTTCRAHWLMSQADAAQKGNTAGAAPSAVCTACTQHSTCTALSAAAPLQGLKHARSQTYA
jgi:hypothetical protein